MCFSTCQKSKYRHCNTSNAVLYLRHSNLYDQGWSGIVKIGGLPIGPNKYFKVCRFQYLAETGSNNNQRNVQPYSNVKESIDNQNYFISTNTMPTCPIISGLQTVLHQDCRNITGNLSTITGPTGMCPSRSYNTLP